MNCEQVLERLPWLLNGTLEPAERKSVLEHLAGCAGCRAALTDTRFAWEVFAQHLPVADLVAWAAGEPAATAREVLESHLAECPQCAADLETIRASRLLLQHEDVAVLPAARRAAPARSWRNAALAAGLAGVVAATGWVHSSRQISALETRLERAPAPVALPQPAGINPERLQEMTAENQRLQAENQRLTALARPREESEKPVAEVNTLVQDVYSESAVRGGSQAANRVAIPAVTRLATLILHPDGEAAAGRQEVEIVDRQGKVVWRQGGLVRSPSNDYTLTFDRRLLPAGSYVLRLYSSGRRTLLESFPLELS